MQRKSGFLTLCFACLPGAGEMYLGYMKRGLSLMLIFWGVIFLSALFNIGILCSFLPVVWAYAFFDTFNLRAQTPEQYAANPDDFIFDVEALAGVNWKRLMEKRHGLLGGAMILLGVYSLYKTFVHPLLWDLYNAFHLVWLGNLMDGMPTLVVAVLMIALGMYLLKGPASPAEPPDDYTAFRGGDGDA